ncbi:hypothetical protein [Labrys okinawensis]|uniref:hypothetical protein n=1 Tax=Labrys okinawensis TaxID=346911 RepID=UPI0011B2922D|nr:hypothetical protein [Labrys okinawensis]
MVSSSLCGVVFDISMRCKSRWPGIARGQASSRCGIEENAQASSKFGQGKGALAAIASGSGYFPPGVSIFLSYIFITFQKLSWGLFKSTTNLS